MYFVSRHLLPPFARQERGEHFYQEVDRRVVGTKRLAGPRRLWLQSLRRMHQTLQNNSIVLSCMSRRESIG